MADVEITRERFDKYGPGISEKGIHRALRRNDARSNVASVSEQAREQDADFYNNMPMYGDASDPLNHNSQQDKEESVMKALANNARLVNESRMPSVMAPSTAQSTEPSTEPKADPDTVIGRWKVAVVGFVSDVRRWDSLPAQGFVSRVHYCTQNRMAYLTAIVVILLLFVMMVRYVARKR